jgi:apolipoprotein D and lipocalin family protein
MKKKLLAILVCLTSLSALANGGSAEKDAQFSGDALRTIPSLDVARYMGTWFEIAKYPNWFQKKCTNGGTRAEYTPMSDGRVQVTNRCRLASGKMDEAIGVARQVGPATSAKLEVRFAPSWLSFLPFIWGNYWVIDLDDDYQLVAVSEPKKEYLWILSRTPKVDPVSYNALMNRLRQRGFDLEKLEVTKQD